GASGASFKTIETVDEEKPLCFATSRIVTREPFCPALTELVGLATIFQSLCQRSGGALQLLRRFESILEDRFQRKLHRASAMCFGGLQECARGYVVVKSFAIACD